MKLLKNLSVIGLSHGAFVDTALEAMRDSSFLSKSDQQILAHQADQIQHGFSINAERSFADVIEPNGPCCSSFPTFDGTCVADGNQGRTARALTRLVAPAYCDGVSTPRCNSYGGELPNARTLSNAFSTDVNDEVEDPSNMSHMHMLWGQFLTHDMFLTPGTKLEGVDCSCGSTHPECHNIEIPAGDPHFEKECIPIKRSHRTFAEFNGEQYQEQVSVVSAFVDGTVVYGTDMDLTKTLRHEDREKMAVSFGANGFPLLPRTNSTSVNPPTDPASQPLLMADDVRTKFTPNPDLNEQGLAGFVSGDARINEHPGLQGLHTVFHLLHNWVVNKLEEQNPSWAGDTDMLFQEARMVVIGAIQNISYDNYLTMLLGADYAGKHGLTPADTVSPFDESKAQDPTIFSEMSTAAFRFGHSQIHNRVPCLNPEWEEMEPVEQLLQDNYFDPHLVEKYGIDAIIRGNVATPGMDVDTSFANDIRNNLFKSFGSSEGGDLLAINIQRGREHGIGSYLEVSRWCRANGYPEAITYKPGMSELLESQYDNMEDIDLYVGGLAENHLEGGIIGPTFGCIFAEQFKRVKSANKFFFTNSEVFSNDQLREVKKLDLATVMCAVGSDTKTVPRDPFFLGDYVDCDSLETPDFSVWTAKSAPAHHLGGSYEVTTTVNSWECSENPDYDFDLCPSKHSEGGCYTQSQGWAPGADVSCAMTNSDCMSVTCSAGSIRAKLRADLFHTNLENSDDFMQQLRDGHRTLERADKPGEALVLGDPCGFRLTAEGVVIDWSYAQCDVSPTLYGEEILYSLKVVAPGNSPGYETIEFYIDTTIEAACAYDSKIVINADGFWVNQEDVEAMEDSIGTLDGTFDCKFYSDEAMTNQILSDNIVNMGEMIYGQVTSEALEGLAYELVGVTVSNANNASMSYAVIDNGTPDADVMASSDGYAMTGQSLAFSYLSFGFQSETGANQNEVNIQCTVKISIA